MNRLANPEHFRCVTLLIVLGLQLSLGCSNELADLLLAPGDGLELQPGADVGTGPLSARGAAQGPYMLGSDEEVSRILSDAGFRRGFRKHFSGPTKVVFEDAEDKSLSAVKSVLEFADARGAAAFLAAASRSYEQRLAGSVFALPGMPGAFGTSYMLSEKNSNAVLVAYQSAARVFYIHMLTAARFIPTSEAIAQLRQQHESVISRFTLAGAKTLLSSVWERL